MQWSDIDNQVNRRTQASWREIDDLARELEPMVPGLDFQQLRTLLSFTQSGLPLMLTWDYVIGDKIERTKTAVVVEYATRPRPDLLGLPGRLRIRYSGFNHEISFPQVVDADSVKAEITYRPR